MNVIKLYKWSKAILTIFKVLIPVLEDLFKTDLNMDGKIGTKETEKE